MLDCWLQLRSSIVEGNTKALQARDRLHPIPQLCPTEVVQIVITKFGYAYCLLFQPLPCITGCRKPEGIIPFVSRVQSYRAYKIMRRALIGVNSGTHFDIFQLCETCNRYVDTNCVPPRYSRCWFSCLLLTVSYCSPAPTLFGGCQDLSNRGQSV